MTNSDLCFIQVQEKVVFQEKTPEKWVVFVKENGVLKADFLQRTQSLDLEIHLAEEKAKCEINCTYLLNNNNKINIDIKVIHESKNTLSRQKIKGVATGQAQVNFNGLILIPQKSQKCDGAQNHRGILLSDKAQITAIPQLEIWADDVQCAHGSAVGPLDEEEVFYLQSRGIPTHEAQQLLLKSFLEEGVPSGFVSTIQKWMEENV